MVVQPKRTWGSRYAAGWRRFWRRLRAARGEAVGWQPWESYGFRPPRCRWDAVPGVYIAGLLPGAEARQTREGAKAACADRDDCAGITCGTPEDVEQFYLAGVDPPDALSLLVPGSTHSSCTARRGEPWGLLRSPEPQEKSFVKNCAGDGDTAHADAETWAAGVALDIGSEVASYSRHPGMFLAGFAADDSTPRDLQASRAACDELGARCSGITCEGVAGDLEDPQLVCTVRASSELLASPVGEVSFAKDGAPDVQSSQGRIGRSQPEAALGGSSVFQFYTGSQSVVHKDRIRLWPKAELEAFSVDGWFCSEFSGFFEAAWHIMFGEPLSQWPRERDPSLPLILKWGVPTLFSYGDEGVI